MVIASGFFVLMFQIAVSGLMKGTVDFFSVFLFFLYRTFFFAN